MSSVQGTAKTLVAAGRGVLVGCQHEAFQLGNVLE